MSQRIFSSLFLCQVCIKFCGNNPAKDSCGDRSSQSTCEVDEDCWTAECRSGTCYEVTESSILPTIELDTNLGLSRLKQLFAKSFGIKIWQDKNINNSSDKGGYPANWSMGPSNTWDITEKGGTDQGIPNAKLPTPPVVASVGSCRDEKCTPHWPLAPGELPSITINGKSSGTVISRTGSLRATIQFFFWADADQGPIKSVIVDYGNGVVINSGATNFYKNYRGYKSDGSSACDNSDFGHSANACAEEPRTYNPTYTCQRGIGSNWNSTCPDPTVSGGCCVFVPKVQVLDNWGWCNGSCPGEPGGDGCYDGSNRSSPPYTDECRTGNMSNSSTPFAGKIIVVPK
jgi:hypothetical protein